MLHSRWWRPTHGRMNHLRGRVVVGEVVLLLLLLEARCPPAGEGGWIASRGHKRHVLELGEQRRLRGPGLLLVLLLRIGLPAGRQSVWCSD